MTKYDIGRGYIISSDLETVFTDSDLKVEVIPCWRHWTIKQKVTE